MDNSDIISVILCGGQGKRMRSTNLHKVCFPINGTPAIIRTIDVLKSAGLSRFLIVVGQMAEQVISTITQKHPDVFFVYQPSPRGTGHAVSCAVEVLTASKHDGLILIVMGDKVIEPYVIERLIETHRQTNPDLTLTTLPKTEKTTAGRVVVDSDENVLGIVELADIQRAARSGEKITLAGKRFTARQIERRADRVNASLYLFDASTLYDAIHSLRDDNAQGELYLTDTVEYVAKAGKKITLMHVENPEDLMAYNTPEELLEVEEVIRKRLAGRKRIRAPRKKLPVRQLRRAGELIKIFEENPPRLRRTMIAIYGQDTDLLAERRKAFVKLLQTFIRHYGPERKVVLARAPGRVNLLGRHVDHRGGHVNVMAINKEIIVAAAAREDDTVTLMNVNARQFPRRQFRIGELLRAADWYDWVDFINSATVRHVLEASHGDWSNYAKAAVLRLQHACSDHRLIGADCVVSGNIPMGAGLSSSSAMVVGMAEVAVALNGLDITTQQFVDLCGEGEWFVGSRGGSADHAAIRSGKKGRIAKVGFFPFRIVQTVALPDNLALIIANSGIVAAKSASARDTYNHRVATYDLAEMLLRKRSGMLKNMEHLRDVNPNTLGVSPAEIYRAVKLLPIQITRSEARELLKDQSERLEQIFSSHADIGPYRLRDVAMFGIAECLRSEMFADLLRSRRINQIGQLMSISHDGDRIVRYRNGKPIRFRLSYTDKHLDRLIADATSDDPVRRASAELFRQPGRYTCSTPEIDLIVDLVSKIDGVYGAQLAGAGMGGCAMILCEADVADKVFDVLRQGYYRPRGIKFDAHLCRPVAGSGILTV